MKTQITVQRRDGSVEIIILDRIPVWEQAGIEASTRRAGRGEILQWDLLLDGDEIAEQDAQDAAICIANDAESQRQEAVWGRYDARRYGARKS